MGFVFAPGQMPVVDVMGDTESLFPVRRIYGVGANYAASPERVVKPAEFPFIFSKWSDSLFIAHPGQTENLDYPKATEKFCYEVELVVGIGKNQPAGTVIKPEEAMDYVWGYAAGIDFIRKDLQLVMKSKGYPWEVAKAFESSAVITPMVPKSRVPDVSDLSLWLDLNGEPVQRGTTAQMLETIPDIIAEISRLWTLQAGDLIYSGTPPGAGEVRRGEMLEGGVKGVGEFRILVC